MLTSDLAVDVLPDNKSEKGEAFLKIGNVAGYIGKDCAPKMVSAAIVLKRPPDDLVFALAFDFGAGEGARALRSLVHCRLSGIGNGCPFGAIKVVHTIAFSRTIRAISLQP